MPLLQSVLADDVAPRRPTSGVPIGVFAMVAHASTASRDELVAPDAVGCSPAAEESVVLDCVTRNWLVWLFRRCGFVIMLRPRQLLCPSAQSAMLSESETPCRIHWEMCSSVERSASKTSPTPMAFLRSCVT